MTAPDQKGIIHMQSVYEIIGYHQILQQLSNLAVTPAAKSAALELRPHLQETKLRKELSDTAQAKEMLEIFSAPPLPAMERIPEFITRADTGELLPADAVEAVGSFLVSVSRMKGYLKKGCERQISLTFYQENLDALPELQTEILRCIRNGQVDDAASNTLRDIRRKCGALEEKIREKADAILRSQKKCMAENFIVCRNGRLCLPVRKDCKGQIPGHLVDKSSTGSTLFIEPAAVAALREEYEQCRLEEENEERIILYTLLSRIAEQKELFLQNIRTLEKLDFAFAKGKLALDMNAVCPSVNTEGRIFLKQARHPALPKESAVPLDFSLGEKNRGMIITGPGTDPAEGMGIAVAVLEKLRESGCLFLVTTHYPEVKTYAETTPGVLNARMAFDRDSLTPLYQLEMGESGESCALYIAKRLGLPDDMLYTAAHATYKEKSEAVIRQLNLSPSSGRDFRRRPVPSLEKKKEMRNPNDRIFSYSRGDSVTVQPEGVIGIVVKPADRQGNVLVQIKKEKRLISHKRLRLKVAASKLYPEDYDFSIIFDTVENRKARHQMNKRHQEGLMIEAEDY